MTNEDKENVNKVGLRKKIGNIIDWDEIQKIMPSKKKMQLVKEGEVLEVERKYQSSNILERN